MAEMTISDRGILEIAEHEGIVPAPYRDSVGVWTWGIGHTRNAGGLDPAKMPMAMPGNLDAAIDLVIETFRDDVVKYAARVNTAIKVPLKQHEFDALVSFDLNTGGIHRAQLTKAINQGDPDAARHFMGWLRPPEIRKRRKAEMSLFRTGDYDANGDTIPIWRTNGAGRLSGIMQTITGAEMLARFGAEPAPVDLPRLPDLTPMARALNDIDARHRALGEALVAAHEAFAEIT